MDNVVYGQKLTAEHGLSLYIEMDQRRILFDTGQSGRFMENAEVLGIDLSAVDTVVLSHGHYDHTGGLEAFCRMNDKANIYVKEGFFAPKYKNKTRFIGTPYNPGLFDSRIRVVKENIELFQDFFLISVIPLKNTWDTHFQNFFIQSDAGFSEDTFSDEQFIAYKSGDKINIISACSHRGISNMIDSAIAYFDLPVGLVLGGFHIKDSSADFIGKLSGKLLEYKIGRIGACHCTGIDPYSVLKNAFKTNVFYYSTGNEIEI
jgi:7,8-dihydropterin-6-yl-methyl-4-(beta-D-ribofuranosyl)aminobenzene 5'-phosphate synthase